jgi:hypothetical protein
MAKSKKEDFTKLIAAREKYQVARKRESDAEVALSIARSAHDAADTETRNAHSELVAVLKEYELY